MSSYHFPIIVGHNQSERIVIIHLLDDNEKKSYQENRVIITNPGNTNVPLFKIPDEVQLIDIGGNLYEVDYENENEKNFLKVTMTAADDEKADDENILLTPIHNGDFYEYRIPVGVFDGPINFSITHDAGGNQINLDGKIHIVRPNVQQPVLRINADLGSDATQVNYYRTLAAVGVQGINIVDNLKDAYSTSRKYDDLNQRPANNEPMFLQMEKANPKFFKTGNITFRKEENGVLGNIEKDINDPETFINYLNVSAAAMNANPNKGNTWMKEQAFSKKIINIKMLYAHMSEPYVEETVADIAFTDGQKRANGQPTRYPITNKEHLLKVLSTIYDTIITVSTANLINDISTADLDNGNRYFSILLLVPNIYSQENIDMLLYKLNNMMNKNQDPNAIRYDFRVISESDSAFVGIKHVLTSDGRNTILREMIGTVSNPKQKDVFLIIDAGKGTTDYSIVRFDSEANNDTNNDMVSLKRGGIVGAGGAIDYVFARVFARQVFHHAAELRATIVIDEPTFIHRFMKMIESVPPTRQNSLMLIVETLKKEYRSGENGTTTASVFSCFGGEETTSIVNELGGAAEPDYQQFPTKHQKPLQNISNWCWDGNSRTSTTDNDVKEVEWVCKTIADSIINDMIFVDRERTLTNQIDFVIFNGRSFLFEPLKKAFINAIEPHRGVFGINGKPLMHCLYHLNKKLKGRGPLRNIDWENKKNLREARLQGYSMKSVSVLFASHDLCVNYNSDLCCMNRLDTTSEEFEQSNFWTGFTETIRGGNHYYIGYNNRSFAPMFPEAPEYVEINEKRRSLIRMTMFPIKYHPNQLNGIDNGGGVYTAPAGSGHTAPSGTANPAANTGNSTQPSSGPSEPTPKVDQANIDLNELNQK